MEAYLDVEAVEKAEAQIDQFVEKRARERADEQKVADLWAESDRRERVKRRRENRAAWHDHEMHMSELHASLSEEHRLKAQRLMEPETA